MVFCPVCHLTCESPNANDPLTLNLICYGHSNVYVTLLQGTYAGQFVMEGFLNLHWARWKRVLLTRTVAMVPCVIIAVLAVNSLDYLDEYINVEQSMLVRLHYQMYAGIKPPYVCMYKHLL